MQKSKEKPAKNKPGNKHEADKLVTGQQHQSNNDSAPIRPMDKGKMPPRQQDADQQDIESNEDEMGSGKRQDDN